VHAALTLNLARTKFSVPFQDLHPGMKGGMLQLPQMNQFRIALASILNVLEPRLSERAVDMPPVVIPMPPTSAGATAGGGGGGTAHISTPLLSAATAPPPQQQQFAGYAPQAPQPGYGPEAGYQQPGYAPQPASR
jgi:hypothetical protein